jgi:hypothetical protein
MRWAMIDANNIVENVIIWDGQGDLFSGKTVVQLQDGEWCSIGASYAEDAVLRFVAQPEPQEPEI